MLPPLANVVDLMFNISVAKEGTFYDKFGLNTRLQVGVFASVCQL